jgi:hypothetical protein
MKEIIVRQYVEVVRTLAIQVEDDADISDAVIVANGLPLSAENLPEGTRLVSDWSYVCDSDDFEDEDGNPAD